jgi:signal transduction histidine kinase
MDGFSKMLIEDHGEAVAPPMRALLDRIRANAEKMNRLIEALLMLSRVTRAEPKRETVDLSALAHAIVAELRRRDPEREVDVQIAGGMSAEGDGDLLRVALENLLGNAWKYTGKTPGAEIAFRSEEKDGARWYSVRDNGAGFPASYAHRLFAPFTRLHRQADFPGTGVGLATVRRIVERHGGRVWAEGAEENGAAFHFTLGSLAAGAGARSVGPEELR